MAGSSKSTAALVTQILATIFPNASNSINAADHQQLLEDLLASIYTRVTDGANVETPPNGTKTLAAGPNTVTFSTPIGHTNYSVTWNEVGTTSAGAGRVHNKTSAGFDIDAVQAGDIDWQTMIHV
jgi:hypothetical protein